MSLVFDNPLQPVLNLPPNRTVWQQSAFISDQAARWRIYLNQLGLASILSWFQEEFSGPVAAWPETNPWDIWHVVNGISVTLGQRRIVVMLTETFDASELEVPQEWLDIPSWAADYYIAAYADIDSQHLALWGYATHSQLKTKGRYDPQMRTYHLNDMDLVQDFSAFWVAQQLEQLESSSLERLPRLSPMQVQQLTQRLTNVVEPRWEIPFAHWGALLENDQWRRQFYTQCYGTQDQRYSDREMTAGLRQGAVNLGEWFNQLFGPGWQTLDSLLPAMPALSFRTTATHDSGITRGKKIVLMTATATVELVLSMTVTPEADHRKAIRIRLYPANGMLLPEGVVLTLMLPDTGESLQRVQSREQDNFIQLPPFRCPSAQSFRVNIFWDGAALQEDFVS